MSGLSWQYFRTPLHVGREATAESKPTCNDEVMNLGGDCMTPRSGSKDDCLGAK